MTTDNTTALLETLAELRKERDELRRVWVGWDPVNFNG